MSDIASNDAMLASLRTARDELTTNAKNLDQKITDLETQLADARAQRQAIDAAAPKVEEALAALAPPSKAKAATNGTAKKRRRKVTADRVVKALNELGGKADNDQLSQALKVTDGRSLAGVRKAANNDDRYSYDDGIWALSKPKPKKAPAAPPAG